ncbi:hypothetical protein PRIC2_003420 [Phytophthora ramorum]
MAFLAQIQARHARKLEAEASILRLIGGDSLEPRPYRENWSSDEVEPDELANESEVEDNDGEGTSTTAADRQSPEELFERFRKMLKVGVPRVSVEAAMRKDGINPAGLDGPVPEGAVHIDRMAEQLPTDIVALSRIRRRKWHWTQVPKADRAPPPPGGSIWMEVSEEGVDERISRASQARLRELFVKDVGDTLENAERDSIASVEVALSTVQRPDKTGNVRILTGQKALNLEMVLKPLKKPFNVVAYDLNILTAVYLSDTDIKTIVAMWPSVAEARALDEYSGEFESLGMCEQFLMTLRAVPRPKEKLQCLLLKLELASRVQMVILVTRALNQLCSSQKYCRVMRLIRDFGNIVNNDVGTKPSRRFSLESLLRMAHTKAYEDPKVTTAFDAFMEFIRTEENGELVNFHEEISLVLQCKSVSVDALTAEFNQLREGYLLVKSMALTSSSKDAGISDSQAELARGAFSGFADEVDGELRALHKLFDRLESCQKFFQSWFEENTNSTLDAHLRAIVQFALEVRARNPINLRASHS